MSETPKNMWLVIVAKLFRWIFLIVGSVATFTAGEFLIRRFTEHTGVADKGPYITVNLIAIAFCLWLLSPILRRLFPTFFRLTKTFCHWLFTWRTLRRTLVTLAVLTTLIAIFYTEEDWRGKRDWENCKRQLEAQGVVLDWSKFLPPSVPDDQNFFTASTNILLRFKETPGDDGFYSEEKKSLQLQWLKLYPLETNGVYLFPVFNNSKGKPLVIAKIVFLPSAVSIPASDTNIYHLALNDPALSEKLRNIISARIGQTADGAAGFEFSQFQLTNVEPVTVIISGDSPLSIPDIEKLIPSEDYKRFARLQIVGMTDPNSFKVRLTDVHITAAADYLKWSDQFVPAFNDLREALKRPYAILPGDYSRPYQIPVPNFVVMRALAQTLAQRAQCYFLLGEPDKALHELMLIHDACRILEKPPTGQPETLVEAMIDVAIHGLYVRIIQEGFQRHEWREPQLEALQAQLAQVNLPPVVEHALAWEMAATAGTLETISTTELKQLFQVRETISTGPRKTNVRESLVKTLKFTMVPRGWIYQNMVSSAKLVYQETAGFDSPENTILPEKFKDISRELDAIPLHDKFIAAVTVPNITKAWQTTAYDQAMVNEAQIVCALERYHLAHGEYPETLDRLVPQFIEAIPQDVIGGQPLHYRRTNDGKFLLYSVGWNETDDGGQSSQQNTVSRQNGAIDYAIGDWVWPVTAN